MASSKNNSKGFNLAGRKNKYGFKTVPNDSVSWGLYGADGKYFGDVSYKAYKAVTDGTLSKYTPKNENEENIILSFVNDPGITLKAKDGTEFGKISYNTLRAINENRLDKYAPANNSEKQVLNDFKAYAEESAKQERIDSNPVFKRYNIDPNEFTFDDLNDWAQKHNHQLVANSSTMAVTVNPIYKGGFLGIGGKKLSTKQEDEDAQVLYQLAKNNVRKISATTDYGKFMSAIEGYGNGLTFGAMRKLSDIQSEREYKKAGLNEKEFIPQSQSFAKTVNEHQASNLLGDFGGGVAATMGLGELIGMGARALKTAVSATKIGTALKGVKWISKSAPWIERAITDGITFGISNGTRTAFEGGTFEDVLKSSLRGSVSGAAGGTVSVTASRAIDSLLTNPKYADAFWGQIKNKVGTYYAKNAAVGLADATADNLTDTIMSKVTDTEKRKAKDVALDFGVTLIFGMLKSATSSKEATANSKEYIQREVERYCSDYEALNNAAKKTQNLQDFTDIGNGIIQRGENLKKYLQGHIFTGAQDLVDSVSEKIDYVNAGVREKVAYAKETAGSKANATAETANTGADTTKQAVSASLPNTNSTPVSSDLSTPIIESVAAAEAVTPQNTSATDTAIPKTSVKTNASGELGEIMDSEPIATFTPETASNEIKKLENLLITRGADDTARKEIITAAVEIEKTLDGSDRNIRSVFNDVSKITSTAISKMQSQAELSNTYWSLFSENFKAVPTGNAKENISLVTEYSNAYAKALKNSNPEKYNSVMLSSDGQDLSAELPKTIISGELPKRLQNAGGFSLAVSNIKNIINAADAELERVRYEIYGNNAAVSFENNTEAQVVTEPKNITLTQMGDFYEAFGNEALVLAEKLNLTPTYKTINGVKTAMVGFPAHVLEKYQSALGNSYNLIVSNNAANTLGDSASVKAQNSDGANAQNMYEIMDELGLTYDEQRAILEYKSSGSYKINEHLYENETLTEEEKMLVENINTALKKFPIYEGEVYRNLVFDWKGQEAFDNFVAQHKQGEIISCGAPISSSKVTDGYELEGELLVHMTIQSKNGRDISNIGIEEEQEVLFAPNATFYVQDVQYDGKIANIYLEERLLNGLVRHQEAVEIQNDRRNESEADGGSGENEYTSNGEELSYQSAAVRGRGATNDSLSESQSERNSGRSKEERGRNNGQNERKIGIDEQTEGRAVRTLSDTAVDEFTVDGNGSVENSGRNEIENRNAAVSEGVAVRVNSDTHLTDKCDLVATKHSATGEDIWVVTLKERLSQEEYNDLKGKVKAVGGYYSRFAKTPDGKAIPGFIFKTKPTENELAVFNDFFGKSDETALADKQPSGEILKNQSESDTIKTNNNEGGNENVKSQSEILAGESVSDGGGLHTGADGIDAEVGNQEADEPHRNGSGKGLPKSTGADGSRPDVRNDSEGVHGTDDAGNAVSEIRGNSARITDNEPETIETAVKTVKKRRPSNKGNFIITDDIATEFDNTAPSAKDNIEAIELLLTLENEGRAATAEEKKILAKYKGWGGIDTRYLPYELSSRFGKLFDWEQRKAMQSSQNNAFFTPTKVIDAMYAGLKRMGFKGGNVLETSMGVGNFFGRMPSAMSSKSALTGVELESYTARIAQYLYPGATVINKPFQDVAIKNGSYDLVIGNVPFGQNKISYNKKKYSLHNYFIISSLDKVRDGGVVAVITSAGTLDSHSIDARKAIMDRANVVACYKLPEKVFSRNASTDVQADLLILRKRANDEKPKGDSILNTITTKQGLRINEYFDKHPENVLGALAKGTNTWGEITTVQGDADFYDKLNAAMKKLPKDLFSGKTDLKPIETILSLSDKPRFFEENGKVYADDGAGTATEVSKNQANTVRDYIAVRDAYKELLNAYENGETITEPDGTVTIREMSDEDIKPLRDKLSRVYDNFYEKHGAITGDGKKKIGTKKSANNTFLEADADYYLVGGLERYDAKNRTFVKSALFDKDTLRKKRVTSVPVASDALAVSLNESGRIDFARMRELTGKTEKQLAEELKGEIVLTPEGDYVLTDIYLSGNIYEKLEAVKDKPEFKEQREMLKKVIPTPKGASDITVKLGANYIDAKHIEQFAKEVFNTSLNIKKDISGRWVIDGVRQVRYGDVVNVKYGCNAFNAVQLLEKILNDGEITATKKVGTGRDAVTVFDSEMTDIAKQKADDIRAAFEAWVFGDSDRRTEIVDNYNRTYNNYRPLDYERIAEKLSFNSMDEALKAKLYPHQKNGIARFLFGGNMLFAHGVGTGKTFEMIASVMEAKRMGIINKAAMVVPNNKVVDFKNDIAQAYPNAKVLVIDTANKKRQTMLGLVNSNDWDIVLIARTTFTKIPVSPEFQTHYIAQQLEDLELQIAEAESDKSVSRRQLKGMITQRDNLEQKIKDLDAETKRDANSVDFEKLGIDCICADEAHNYKSILTPTKLNIKGLVNRSNAQMANDMLMKLDYLRSIDGRIIFGTGTPITNTVSEIYNMMRMVRPDILEDAGIRSLDEWVNTFAKIDTVTEIGIDNQIKNKSTQIIRSFINTTEMVGMFRQFADIVFTKDVVKNLPKAKYIDVEIEGTDKHKQIEKQISEVIAKTEKSDLLKVYGQLMSMADAASVDLRMLSGAESEYNIFKDYSLDELDYKNSKINVMCDNVYAEYTASNDIKGTQIIFCDKGSGSGAVYSFNLHKDIMQKLTERGIPEEQIVIIKSQSDAQLEALYEKVNAGEVRVLIGTSQKMAEGLNVQKRVVAIHHPTVTYKPSDKEQGDARGVRAGNINDEVHIYRYLQKNTFDSHKWQAQDRKSEMINKALRGEAVAEMEDIGADEDSGAGIDAATAMAITSGNPLVKEKIDIDKEVARLKTLQRNYLSEVYRYQDAVSKNPNMISRLTSYADNIEQDIALKNKYSEKASIVIKGKNFKKQSDANKALSEAVKTAPKNGQYSKLGTYNGFDIMFKGDTGGMGYSVILKGFNEYSVDYVGSGNNIARFAGALGRLDAELTRVREKVDTLKNDLEFAKKEVSKPFEKEKELTEALEKQKDITYRYEHYGEGNTKYFISESEDFINEQSGSSILSGNSGRAIDESARKQAKRVSGYKQKLEGKTQAERKSTAKELSRKGYTQEIVSGNHKYTLIKDEGYNDDMRSIVSEAKAQGKEVGFFIGNAVRKFDGQRNFKIDGIKLSDNKILIRYDGTYSPQALLMHEIVHTEWNNPKMQRAKDIILSDLSESVKKEILQSGRYKDYMELYNGDKDAVWQEFIADIFADMNKFSDSYIDTVVDYWYNDKVIDRYNPSEYIRSTDAGGNEAVLDNIGFGNEYSLSNHTPKIELSKQEYALVSKAVMAKNAGKADNELKPVDFVYAADEFYVYENHSIGEFSVINKYDVETEYDKIDDVKECVNNGTYTDRERLNRLIDDVRRGKGSNSRNNGGAENGRYAMADDRVSGTQQRSNSIGHSSGVGADNKSPKIIFDIPYNEKRQLDDYILRKNHSGGKLEKVDCKEIGNNFYIWENNSKTDYTVVNMIEIDGNEDLIAERRKELKNGNFGIGKKYNVSYEGRSGNGRRSDNSLAVVYQRYGTKANGNGGISSEQSESNTVGCFKESGRDTQTKYALSSYDTDSESLTPERKKEIFEQWKKDHAGLEKPTKRQLWGERAQWVAHNATRVFPSIPERGEKGTFFAEFRKYMIQWKNLPTTASFMVQDKLNKMTDGLTPKEFKTFSELVYFLDLQEEAQIQKDRGYNEILLPNEITPKEVDEIVNILNGEATDKVQQALIKRQNIWDELKQQYIDLNSYIGFDTDQKFKRKNYYHHQVIDYMNKDRGGTGSREIGIKAGRGWLKERQGSTKAINTDFLMVENKAMMQMQYDVYIAETLGKIKQQYDIKPKLEKEAFEHNKKALNDIIKKECTDENGNVMLDKNGKPDSETYRKQKWYNAHIMWGFNGLFDLAESGELSDYDGEYTNVIEALKKHDLNADGLYKYVGILSSIELPDNATDAQEQAVQNARTVLKYTAQKKAWIKELLADDYQTWETLAKSMSDTHAIHQPRRGNYFYTKTILDEDAFNKAHDDMILSLVSGEVDLGNVDVKKLFEQYSDTVRLTGAAYEQWVLPKEIVKTMDEIANSKQASEVAKVARSIVSAWKGWATSVNPLRTVKFGLRNLAGDLDAVIAGNPKVTLYSKQAVEEIHQAMKHKNYSDDFMEWVKRGGYTSMIFANEMDTEMQDKLFSHLKDKQGASIFKIPVKAFEKYYDGVENVHNFREAILRYSAYLYFKNEINKNSGNVKDYVASNRYIVKGLTSVEDKAYQLSKDLLGAYDEVGKLGQTLRRYLIPFYSFTETNMKRYYRMFENIITSNDKIPKKAAKLLLKALMANMMVLLTIAWNRLVMKETDDKLPPQTRDVPHITFGQIGDNVYAFRQLGSFSELLEWVGLDDYKWTKEDLTAPVDKAWGMITPFVKMPIELASGLNFYPSLTQPRAIRDKWQHFFNSLGVDDVYNEVTGKPTRGIGEILKGSVIYNYDYKESAYYEILDIKREWQGSESGSIYKATPKSNALYYMKTAVRYKDKEAALKYLDEYFENGGTAKGIKQSIATLNPMYGFTGKDTMEEGNAFIASLSDEEKEKLKIAQDFYENDLMLPQEVTDKLGRKDITDEEAKNLLRNYINAKCK